ncbi:ubiquinone/menaquinone biosynthesis methyltransferase [Acrocarpospora phusangensis]|uniref:Ubiquinone/menaquinone biosynthesis methyltransferase n=1 Tax=Acrocarpospora phusangensis TaxID=1070424 RepID=A0A919UMF1_9ACTN|nr:methyltransferase domain-containing protein [Acrocarpospora phusangensis]GIH23238.1 ubiquinone/menaquinone biosynthesis methyltransferase [Acrocarpospora phusangensis]
MRASTENDVRRVFDRVADDYDRQMAVWERRLLKGAREWAVGQVRGHVVEIGVGSGLNIPLYPGDVTVVGVELSERMLSLARRRAVRAGLGDRVELVQGDAQRLSLSDGVADTVLSTFTMCTIPDPAAAAREAHRVLKPGGRFVLAEHGPSSNPLLRTAMRLIEPLTVRKDADYLTRDPRPYLEEAGFRIEEVRRSAAGVCFRVLAVRPLT